MVLISHNCSVAPIVNEKNLNRPRGGYQLSVISYQSSASKGLLGNRRVGAGFPRPRGGGGGGVGGVGGVGGGGGNYQLPMLRFGYEA